MLHLHRLLQVLFTVALVGGFWLWWVLDHVGYGYPPEDDFLRWWHELDGQPEFYLLIGQLAYPVYWWLSRMLRWAAFSDRAAARRSLDDLLQRPFDRIIVGHGMPLVTRAKESLAAAYDWLPAAAR